MHGSWPGSRWPFLIRQERSGHRRQPECPRPLRCAAGQPRRRPDAGADIRGVCSGLRCARPDRRAGSLAGSPIPSKTVWTCGCDAHCPSVQTRRGLTFGEALPLCVDGVFKHQPRNRGHRNHRGIPQPCLKPQAERSEGPHSLPVCQRLRRGHSGRLSFASFSLTNQRKGGRPPGRNPAPARRAGMSSQAIKSPHPKHTQTHLCHPFPTRLRVFPNPTPNHQS